MARQHFVEMVGVILPPVQQLQLWVAVAVVAVAAADAASVVAAGSEADAADVVAAVAAVVAAVEAAAAAELASDPSLAGGVVAGCCCHRQMEVGM